MKIMNGVCGAVVVELCLKKKRKMKVECEKASKKKVMFTSRPINPGSCTAVLAGLKFVYFFMISVKSRLDAMELLHWEFTLLLLLLGKSHLVCF